MEGRIEVFTDSHGWGTVCNDGNEDGQKLSDVVCSQLGFGDGDPEYGVSFGSTQLPMLLHDLRCTGSEDTLLDCREVRAAEKNCSDPNGMGVRCGRC